MSRIKTSSIVAKHLPEHIREDYPTFVSFIEAYYEYLQSQGVDYSSVRDIDLTLNNFIDEFKKELAYNLPNIITNERFLLQNIKDHYLAKGSEKSYKLLFRLLFGKDVELFYPGQQMLRASDGRWNQERSIFAKVTFGDANDIIGKVVEIEDGNKILKVEVNKKLDLQGEVDRIVALGGDVYEFFLDKSIFGEIKAGNIVRYQDKFKAIVLSTTSKINIYEPGGGFRIGQVFEIKSSTGTGTLIKVTKTNDIGGIVNAQVIKFGVGYIADFIASILPSDSLTSRGVVQEETDLSTISIDTGLGPIIVGLEPTINISELGFISNVDYVEPEYVDGAYSGTILKEFSFDVETSISPLSGNVKPAIIEVNLGALAQYPGYYENNNGFLSDSVFIQDSKYYQIYSYVIKIDERLSSYKNVVKTMVHPAGMEVFGQFEITNNFNLSIDIQTLFRSLGIGFEEPEIFISDRNFYSLFTSLSSPAVNIEELTSNNFVDSQISTITSVINKDLTNDLHEVTPLDDISKQFSFGKTELVVIDDSNIDASIGLSLNTNQNINDSDKTRDVSKSLDSPEQIIEETNLVLEMNGTKYMNLPIQYLVQSEFGYVVLDPYEEGNYFSEIYVNNRDAIFSS
jgi:hypothetical protein